MTLAATARRAGPFLGNNVTTAFPFAFKVFAAEDLQVLKTLASGIASQLVLDSDYSVALNADQDASPGGSITYPISGSPLATGESLVLGGDLPLDQLTDLAGGGKFRPEVIEATFDRVVMQIQQIAVTAEGAVRAPVGEAINALPAIASRAGYYVGFDGAGQPAYLLPPTGTAGALAADLARTDNVAFGDALIGVKQPLAGTVARTQHGKNADTVSVKDFGAAGDGTTDDTAALQAALNSGANTVYFPPGTYRITSTLTIPESTVLRGAGRRSSTILVDGAIVGASKVYGAKSPLNVMKIEVRGLGFKGVATALGALLFDKGDQVVVDSCDFYDFILVTAYGVRLVNVYHWWVSNCKFENIGAVGLALASAASVGCNQGVCGPNNDFIGNNRANFIGTAFDRGQTILVYGNNYEGSSNGNKGIDLNGTEGITITQNYIELWVGGAIVANSGLGNRRVTIEQNVINALSTNVCNFNDTTTPNQRITFRANRFADTTGGQTAVFFGSTTGVVFADNDPDLAIPSDKFAFSPTSLSAYYVTQSWNPGSVADKDSIAGAFTITGAAAGDLVLVTFDQIGGRDMQLTAHVQSAGSVRVVLYNDEGAAVDLPLGTLKFWIIKSF